MAQTTKGRAGIGVVFRVQLGSGYYTVGGVSEMQALGASLGNVDATHLDSPNGYSEFIPVLKRPEQWTFTLQYDENDFAQAKATGLWSKLETRQMIKARLDFSGHNIQKALESDGYVAQMGAITIQPDQIMSRQVTFQPTGRVTVVDLSGPGPGPLTGLDFSAPESSGYIIIM